jgi:hypothetical protein
MGPPDAARFHATVWCFADTETRNYVVDHDRARCDALRNRLAPRAIARPHAGGQAVFGVVCQANCLIFSIEGHHRQHRPKRFFLHDPHCMCHIGQHRRSIEV